MLDQVLDQSVSIFKQKLSFQLLFLKLITKTAIVLRLGALLPRHGVDVRIVEALRHFFSLETLS